MRSRTKPIVCTEIAAQAELVHDDYTWKSHTVAVVTDGAAVLGLGAIGQRQPFR